MDIAKAKLDHTVNYNSQKSSFTKLQYLPTVYCSIPMATLLGMQWIELHNQSLRSFSVAQAGYSTVNLTLE